MKFSVETIEETYRIIIISQKHFSYIEDFKKELQKYGCEVFFSSHIPKTATSFEYGIYINMDPQLIPHIKHTVCIYLNNHKKAVKIHKKFAHKVKVISLQGNDLRKNIIDRILWFIFSPSKESFFTISIPTVQSKYISPDFSKIKLFIFSFLLPKRFFITLFTFIFIFHFFYIPPFILSSYYSYSAYKSLSTNQLLHAKSEINLGKDYFQISKNLYSIVRPIYAIFSLSFFPDDFMDVAEKALLVFDKSIQSVENGQLIVAGITNTHKTSQETAYVKMRIENIKSDLSMIEDNLRVMQRNRIFQLIKTKKITSQLPEIIDSITKIRKILKYSDELLADKSIKKYLLLFANNMEIRPGGGFLGSFGIVTISNFTLSDLKIYDVYDADGQLTAHIEPPYPIKKYLNMPHLFLRDSNYSPDFLDNYILAKSFLEKEIQESDLSGAMVITTSAIESFLDAYGEIYLPDFKETINRKNFYIKTQIHVENNFFPGSTQKKTYLSAMVKQLLLNLENASMKQLALSFKKSVDEKQIAFAVENPEIQTVIDSLYWSGRAIEPKCSSISQNCMIDYLFPFDMNVGANKVNYFVKRSMNQNISIKSDGSIHNVFSVQIKNEAIINQFPGGTYKNYFQIHLPPQTSVNKITLNGTLVENYEIQYNRFTTTGFYIEIEPQKIVEIKIAYTLPTKFSYGKGIYQLITQKQIGSSNSDFSIQITLAPNIFMLNQNFTPLVKDQEIVYNTILSADKIFFLELTKN